VRDALKQQRRRPGGLERRGEFSTAITHAAQRGGQPLDSTARSLLEPHFGHDFGQIRVHADGEADNLARSVDAVAFAAGQDVFFRAGRYDPESPAGLHLLAHEVAHTAQQAAGPVSGTRIAENVTVSDPADEFEQAAHEAADAALAGAGIAGPPHTGQMPPSGGATPLSGGLGGASGDGASNGQVMSIQRETDWLDRALQIGSYVPLIGPYLGATRGVKQGVEGNELGWASAATNVAKGAAQMGGFSLLGEAGLGGLAATLGGAYSAGGVSGVLGTVAPTLTGLGGATGATAMPGVLGMEAGAALAGEGLAGAAALGPAAAVIGAGLGGIAAGIGLDHGVDWIGDQITGNEQGDHSISGGIASVMTSVDQAGTGLLRSVGALDESKPEYTQTLGWQLAEMLPSWLQ
jgi:hypothetical protein